QLRRAAVHHDARWAARLGVRRRRWRPPGVDAADPQARARPARAHLPPRREAGDSPGERRSMGQEQASGRAGAMISIALCLWLAATPAKAGLAEANKDIAAGE